MFRIKKIDLYVLRNFVGLFLMTFLICIFILLMQFVWMHVNDLVGKGIGIGILAEFFMYAVVSVVPLSLPLAILLASLMTFGNMGEKFELTAMKSAGISLFRIMRPLTITISFLCVGAFFFSNYALPKSQMKLWTLLFSMRQKSPEFDIPIGEFYDGIQGYHLYVREKDPKHGLLKDLMIYDFSAGFSNATVMVADSGRVYFTADNKYLLLQLYNGESFENLKNQKVSNSSQKIPYRRETFATKKLLIDFDNEFNRYDESMLKDQHVSKNILELAASIDSMSVLAHKRSAEQSKEIVNTKFFGRETSRGNILVPAEKSEIESHNIDSLYASLNAFQKKRAMKLALEKAETMRDQVSYNRLLLSDSQMYIRRHEIELNRKFTLSFACLIFFFIGAPLGAIIRKGGLGMPTVISVLMFIVYYIIDNAGYKMAREGLWPVIDGIWLSSAILLPIGIFLTYKAATDSALLNPDAWTKWFVKQQKMIQKTCKRVLRR